MNDAAGKAPSRARVALGMGVGALAISFAAIFFRLASPIDPLLASAMRLTLAALVLAPASRAALRDETAPRGLARAAVLAGALYALHFGAWVASLSLTTVAASVTLVTATPLLTALAALAEGRDRPTARHVGSIALALAGVALIGGSDLFGGRLVGDGLALVGAAAMAVYLWLVRRLGPALPALGFSGLSAAWGALFLAAAVLARHVVVGPVVGPGSLVAVGWIALSALVPQLVGHTLLTWSLRRATPTEVGLATAAEPVLSTLLAWLWLAEDPGPLVLLGGVLALAGVLVGARPAAGDPRREVDADGPRV